MAENNGGGYALGRLILDYIKTFMWPLVALAVVLVYQDDVRTILKERQVEAFGFKIGDRVQQIESQAKAEIEDIRLLLEAQKKTADSAAPDPQLSQDIEAKLSSLERNLSREIAQVQSPPQAMPAPSADQQDRPAAAGGSRADRAAAAERRGFEALIAHDAKAAAAAFEEARSIWPDYHNVTELAQALGKREDSLADPASKAWPQLYRDILTKYSWGLPSDLRAAIRAEVAKAY